MTRIFQELLCVLGLPVVASFLLNCDRLQRRPNMKFKYIIQNKLVDPPYTRILDMPLVGCNETVVTEYMEMAADEKCCLDDDDDWSFTMTYFSGLGYYITSINGMSETFGSTYWEMIEFRNGLQHDVGAWTYIPQDRDMLTWNLTTYDTYIPSPRKRPPYGI